MTHDKTTVESPVSSDSDSGALCSECETPECPRYSVLLERWREEQQMRLVSEGRVATLARRVLDLEEKLRQAKWHAQNLRSVL